MINGARLRKLRTEKKLSQTELGNIVGVSKSEICNYEKELRSPSANVILDLINFFGVTSDYLMGIDLFATIENPKNAQFVAMTEEEVKFINELRKDKLVYEILLENPKRGADLIKKKIG